MILLIAAFLIGHSLAAQYDCHMFQLNGYKMRVQLKWLGRNWGDYLRRHALALAILPAAAFGPGPAVWAGVLAFALQSFVARPRKAKKPLVYTPRVVRLLFTHAVLTGAIVTLSRKFAPEGAALILAAGFMAGPWLLLLAGLINGPLEKGINRRYINDAKKILARSPQLTVIGVTGSFGKTSAKNFLHKVLSAKYNVLMTPESYNTTLGVVRAIRENLRPTHQIFICEMGARARGQIREICDIVKPRYGVITSIGPQHLESFLTQENIVAAKFELAESLPPDGAVFLNYDNPFIRDRQLNRPQVTYGVEREADYSARAVSITPEGSSFTARLADGRERVFQTSLIGRHNVENIMAAIAVADRLGVPAEDMALAVRRLESVPHRLQLLERGDMTVIDDAFNANEQGALAALEALSMFDGFKILATPGMVELGQAEDEINFRFGAAAAKVCHHVILAGARQTRSIRAGLESENYPAEKISVADSVEEIFSKAKSLDSQGLHKILLLENDLPDNYAAR